MSLRLAGVAIANFAPFAAQVCSFGVSPESGDRADVHILVGENGTGKTRLLSVLMAACGNPKELNDRQVGKQSVSVFGQANSLELLWNTNNEIHQNPDEAIDIAKRYSETGMEQLRHINHGTLANYLAGSPAMAFRSIAAIRDEKLKPMEAVDYGKRPELLVFGRDAKANALLPQALSNMKIRAGMYIASNPTGTEDRTVRMASKLERTLEKITGRSFTFIVEYVEKELRLRVNWGGVRMSLHQVPDGLRAIIGWLGECVAKLDAHLPDIENPLEQPAILFLDEPESNLHPAWQRKIIPALQLLLPRAQIFVATHSPFVVSSVNAGWIYVLKADAAGMVAIDGPRPCSKGDSYIDAVEDVLGLKEWYDPETEALLGEFREARDHALSSGDLSHVARVRSLAAQIAARSESLSVMMGNELNQLDLKLSGSKR